LTFFKSVLRTALAFVLCMVIMIAGASLLLHRKASAQGPFTYRDGGNGTMVLNKNLCFESAALAGYDLCMSRPGVGHLAFVNSLGTAAAVDVYGASTLSGGTKAITFATAFTAAPLCFAIDTTAANAIKTSTTTTVLTVTGTTTDTFNYFCLANPN
jgi:hypothetical protein